MNLNALHRRLMQDVLEIGNSLPLVIAGGYARSCLVGRGSGHPTCSWSPRAADPPRDNYGARLDAGPGVACKSLALPPTLTYIIIHGSYS
jgi:hypothetical protein